MEQERMGYLLTRAAKTIKKKLLRIVSDYDLTQPQYGILRQLYTQGEITSRDLVKQLYMDSSTIMAIVDRLEEKKLIERMPHQQDRRMNMLVLTDLAMQFLPEMLEKADTMDMAMNDIFTSEENIILRQCLTKLYLFGADIQKDNR